MKNYNNKIQFLLCFLILICVSKKNKCLEECAVPEWQGDGYCDDFNNDAACNWDGGDCCNNNMPDYDIECSECQCLDPNFNTATPPTPRMWTTWIVNVLVLDLGWSIYAFHWFVMLLCLVLFSRHNFKSSEIKSNTPNFIINILNWDSSLKCKLQYY